VWRRTEENIAFVHKVNVLGPFLVTQAMLPLLRKGNRKLVGQCLLHNPMGMHYFDAASP